MLTVLRTCGPAVSVVVLRREAAASAIPDVFGGDVDGDRILLVDWGGDGACGRGGEAAEDSDEDDDEDEEDEMLTVERLEAMEERDSCGWMPQRVDENSISTAEKIVSSQKQ